MARPLLTHRTTQTQKKRTQTFTPWVSFEPTIPAFERAKTVNALDSAARSILANSVIVLLLLLVLPRSKYTHHS
jgi:hypothetical protein